MTAQTKSQRVHTSTAEQPSHLRGVFPTSSDTAPTLARHFASQTMSTLSLAEDALKSAELENRRYVTLICEIESSIETRKYASI
jgi:hypothetical protein